MRGSIITHCPLSIILVIKSKGRRRAVYGKNEKCFQNVRGIASRKETILET
jgi:hypothetical protein